jgi:hypothetical protein
MINKRLEISYCLACLREIALQARNDTPVFSFHTNHYEMIFRLYLGPTIIKLRQFQPFYLNSASGIRGNCRLSHSRTFEANTVAGSFWILFSEKSILTWPVKRPESQDRKRLILNLLKNVNGLRRLHNLLFPLHKIITQIKILTHNLSLLK